MFAIFMGALVATTTPVATPTRAAAAPPTYPIVVLDGAQIEAEAAAGVKGKEALSPPDLAAMFKMFDKFFPPQAEPDPARLLLARTTVQGLLPPGSFGKAMGGMMGSMFDRVMNMSEADLADFAPTKPKKGVKPQPPSEETLRQSLAADDPHFEERMRLTRTAVEKELALVSNILEPKMRDGMARAVARKLDQRQLGEINLFLATDSGRALGGEMFAMWFDPELMRSMMGAMPDLVVAMPGAVERVTMATAHLPPMKKKAAATTKKAPGK